MFAEFKKSMMDELEMSNLGNMHYFIGLEVVQSNDGIFIFQKKYAREFLGRFKMQKCNPTNTQVEFGLKLNKDGSGKKVNSTFTNKL